MCMYIPAKPSPTKFKHNVERDRENEAEKPNTELRKSVAVIDGDLPHRSEKLPQKIAPFTK